MNMKSMNILSGIFRLSIGIIFSTVLFASCTFSSERYFTDEELYLINMYSDDSLMRVLQTPVEEDSLFLRRQALPVSEEMMQSEAFHQLRQRMLLTVQNPENEGVGIAAPQVGISRKLIAVQRFDKPGEPFEFYVNPEIIRYGTILDTCGEGCLSVPQRMAQVVRPQEIDIRYRTLFAEDTVETISGFTAVIFHHEIDHLHGIIYTDRVENQ